MIDRLLTHVRLVGKLYRDPRVNAFIKLVFFLVPLAFVLIPWFFEVPDFLPILGLSDDLLILLLGSMLFRLLVPSAVVEELLNEAAIPRLESLRHPDEDHALAKGLFWFIISVTLLGSAFSIGWLTLCLIVYLIRKRYQLKRITMSKPLPAGLPLEFMDALNKIHSFLQGYKYQVVVYPSDTPMNVFIHTRDGYIWLVSKAEVNSGDFETLAKQAACYAARVLLRHHGLRTLIENDPMGLARLIFRKWLDCSRISEEQVAAMILSEPE